jgi:aminodeoxyfutalosine deaminase
MHLEPTLDDTRLIQANGVITPFGEWRQGMALVRGTSLLDAGPKEAMVARHSGMPYMQVTGIILPGTVNTHTHLELSALAGQIEPGLGFAEWARRMLRARAALTPQATQAAIASAVASLRELATVAVGDVSNSGATWELLGRAGMRGVVFRELFGYDEAQLRTQLAVPLPEPTGFLHSVHVPHTLHTVAPAILRRFGERAKAAGPMTLHLAEHSAERMLLETGDGPFAEFLRGLGLAVPPALGLGPIAALEHYGLLHENVLLVHLADARSEELLQLAGMCAVLCPRSNQFIEGNAPDLHGILRAGMRLALGTDSLASCESLDVLADAAWLFTRHRQAKSSGPMNLARTLVGAATWGGAAALGLSKPPGNATSENMHVLPSDWPYWRADRIDVPEDLTPSSALLTQISLGTPFSRDLTLGATA